MYYQIDFRITAGAPSTPAVYQFYVKSLIENQSRRENLYFRSLEIYIYTVFEMVL